MLQTFDMFYFLCGMKIKKAEYVGSFVTEEKCPQGAVPEYAFIGRSNVGKSSLINYLSSKKDLAKVSNTPGKTQTLNFYRINDAWHIVDLPGYGYARIAKSKREEWDRFIRYYLTHRKPLVSLFVLIDSRISPQKLDLEFIEWLGSKGIPFSIIFTKVDKPKSPEIIGNINAFLKILKEEWEELPPVFRTSSSYNIGREEILSYIDHCNNHIVA